MITDWMVIKRKIKEKKIFKLKIVLTQSIVVYMR